MHDLEILLGQLIAQLESAKPNPQVWCSSASRALEQQLEGLQYRLRTLQNNLYSLPDLWL